MNFYREVSLTGKVILEWIFWNLNLWADFYWFECASLLLFVLKGMLFTLCLVCFVAVLVYVVDKCCFLLTPLRFAKQKILLHFKHQTLFYMPVVKSFNDSVIVLLLGLNSYTKYFTEVMFVFAGIIQKRKLCSVLTKQLWYKQVIEHWGPTFHSVSQKVIY